LRLQPAVPSDTHRRRVTVGLGLPADFNFPGCKINDPRPDFYQDGHAGPANVLLLIEVADTSLNYDHAVKRALYARRAIPGTLDRGLAPKPQPARRLPAPGNG
jgi:hypothetical protein